MTIHALMRPPTRPEMGEARMALACPQCRAREGAACPGAEGCCRARVHERRALARFATVGHDRALREVLAVPREFLGALRHALTPGAMTSRHSLGRTPQWTVQDASRRAVGMLREEHVELAMRLGILRTSGASGRLRMVPTAPGSELALLLAASEERLVAHG